MVCVRFGVISLELEHAWTTHCSRFGVMSLELEHAWTTHQACSLQVASGLPGLFVGRAAMDNIQRRELKKKLEYELLLVRSLFPKIEQRLLQVRQSCSLVSDVQLPRNGTKTMGRKEVTSCMELMRLRLIGDTHFALTTKRMPKANQLYNNTLFLVGKEKMPPVVKSRVKRSASNIGGRGRKRRLDTISKLATSKCKNLLKKLMLHKDGWVFNEPVDSVKLQLADYHSIIKSPMDLGTILSKLNKKGYASVVRFAEDVRLTFSNAMTYNPPGNDVHIMALNLANLFEREWKVNSLEFESVDMGLHATEGIEELKFLKKSLGKTKNSKPKRDMSFKEKTRLHNNLQRLPQDMLEETIQMIKEKLPNVIQNDEVVEVDLDTFDNDMLWALDQHSKSCLKKLRDRKKTEANGNQVTTDNQKNESLSKGAEVVPSSSSSSSESESSSDSDSDSSSSGESNG